MSGRTEPLGTFTEWSINASIAGEIVRTASSEIEVVLTVEVGAGTEVIRLSPEQARSLCLQIIGGLQGVGA